MNVLAPFTVMQHIAHGMLLPLLLCFPTGAALQAAKRSPGASCSACPSTGCCWAGRGAGIRRQLLLPVCTLGHGIKGERARAAWPGSSGYLCASFFPSSSSSSSFAAEFRGGCCARRRVKKEGEVFSAARGEVGTRWDGWEREAQGGEGGGEGAGADAGVKWGLLRIGSWQKNKSRFGPRVWGVGLLWWGNSCWRNGEPEIFSYITAP